MEAALIEDIRSDFKKIDKNGDGFIELHEFCYHYAKFNEDSSFDKLEGEFKKLDANGDGKISWEEFLVHMHKRIVEYREKSTPELFKRLDKDGDGQVTEKEVLECSLKAFGYNMNPEEAKAFFGKVDVNNDGKISFEEFRKFMEQ